MSNNRRNPFEVKTHYISENPVQTKLRCLEICRNYFQTLKKLGGKWVERIEEFDTWALSLDLMLIKCHEILTDLVGTQALNPVDDQNIRDAIFLLLQIRSCRVSSGSCVVHSLRTKKLYEFYQRKNEYEKTLLQTAGKLQETS